ncbi:DNA replication ATP-dependent helicase/nuclease dna2 [Teratosphaeria destructans]|uniref:DNA helicase n=1 Tax=Teratosphaeria destructans TaxID=418781 RepID=A0A9W7W3U4_9PEZI|nr:DNA replication ATP-dependent helicase/nuclease dna2 [Teratosphaeria destructans]
MATRTKGFSEQDHTAKAKPPHWRRTNTNRPALTEQNPNVSAPKPPIPATSQAKSKLKAFQFVAGQPEARQSGVEQEAAKVNDGGEIVVGEQEDPTAMRGAAPAIGAGTSSVVQRPTTSSEPITNGSNATPQPLHANSFPCTPGARLSLDDLIGNFDENVKAELPKEVSPEEHVGWIPNSSSTLLTPNRKRKRRARSSSPPTTSSQRHEASALFTGNATQSEKKTPEADPKASLWKSYGVGKDSVEGLRISNLDLFQASPRPLETPAKGTAFRRWASTGNDWPSSRSKRRRTEIKTNFGVWGEEGQPRVSGGKSKIAGMVEKIQETLATQKLAQSIPKDAGRPEGPSSSSPLPVVGSDSFNTDHSTTTSPLQNKQVSEQMGIVEQFEPHRAQPTLKPRSAAQTRSNESDRTLSEDAQPAVQASDVVPPATLHLQSKAPLPAYRRPAMKRLPSGSGRQYPRKPSPPPPSKPTVSAPSEDLDEFGDAFDISVEDLDEIVSQKPPDQRVVPEVPRQLNVPPFAQQHAPAMRPPQQAILVDDDDDDEFGGGDLDEDLMVEAEVSATQAHRASQTSFRACIRNRNPRKARSPKKLSQPPASVSPSNAPRLQRYKIKQTVDGEYKDARGRLCPEKLLMAEDEHKTGMVAITLRDSWTHTTVSRGNIVHIAHLPEPRNPDPPPPATPAGQLLVSDDEHSVFLIVHPDHMLSATTVADSFDCLRKAVLQDRIKATGETAKPMVYGKILHEIFQQALAANRWDSEFLADLVDKTIQMHVEGLWELGMKDTVLAREEITAKMGELAAWAKVFVAPLPSSDATVDDRQGEKVWMSISKLIAIEEHIWSPRYGLKGNVDATIQSSLIDHPKQAAKKLIAPFEVKTGRTTNSPAHRAQTALYTLLLSDRYDVAVKAGILYYLESSTMSRIAPPLVEIRQMVQQRNRLATYIHRARYPKGKDEDELTEMPPVPTPEIEESGLPTLLKNPFKCGRCYAQASCFSYHALVEDGTAESAGMIDDGKKNHSMTWTEAVGHLALTSKDKTEADQLKRWFGKWERLLTFEESEMSRFRKELWTMSSAEREAAGRCFGNLVLGRDITSTASAMTQTVVDGIEGGGGKINRYAYTFWRATTRTKTSFSEGTQLTIGEPVVVSSESGQWALANGYVVGATRHDITVAVDRKLGNARERLDGFDENGNHAFRGTMTAGVEDQPSNPVGAGTRYRLDKDEFSNGLALIRNNLVTMMSSHPVHTKLRQQIIFSAAPSFMPPSQLPAMPQSQLGDMNEDQQAAVSKVLSAQDYALILGMPGTGKTTTIAHIIRALLADDKTILLTSFTHTAVDNILTKIKDVAPPNSILRLGVPAKINPEVQKFCRLAATPRKTIDEIEEVYMGCRIVATTCMGTNHALFNRRKFDVCIVDEASQITLPTSLGPLLLARKFVLVGDHYQLPPLVQNRQALEGGLDVSLFKQLSEVHPAAVAMLGKQYRMCEEIMSLSNTLIYDGKLRCGSRAVAKRTLQLSNADGLQAFHTASARLSNSCRGPCWLKDITHPSRKVIYADTDALGKDALETLTHGKNITNQLEATLTAQIILSFLALGVSPKDLGVITLYRSQLALLRQLFRRANISPDVEIDSADRFQGRDKECIVLSMVRSNEQGLVGELLKDWRRVNVAFTRARSKLVVLGSSRTLGGNEVLGGFLGLVRERGWGVVLPTGAHLMHGFEVGSQSLQSPVALRSSQSEVRRWREGSSPAKSRREPGQGSPRKALLPSASAANRSPIKHGSQGRVDKAGVGGARVINGRAMKGGAKARAAKEHHTRLPRINKTGARFLISTISILYVTPYHKDRNRQRSPHNPWDRKRPLLNFPDSSNIQNNKILVRSRYYVSRSSPSPTMASNNEAESYMVPFLSALQASVAVLLTIFAGAIAAQFGLMSEATSKDVSKFCVRLALPALLIVNVGEQLHAETALRYVPIIVWALIYNVLSMFLGFGLTRAFNMPDWTTPAIAFNNTTSLPLLLVQSLDATGILARIDSAEGVVERAKSYFLVNAMIGNSLTFALGPRLLNGQEEDAPEEDAPEEGKVAEDEGEGEERQNGHLEAQEREAEEANERSSLLPNRVARSQARASVRARFETNKYWRHLPPWAQTMVEFAYQFVNPPVIGAVIGAVVGLVPALHRLFFNEQEKGGYLNAWLTSAIKNVGDLFAALQVIVVGVKLSQALLKLKKGEASGRVPWLPMTIITLIRFVLWPAISISVVYALASKTGVLGDDPILWFAMMLMPVGPPAMKLTALADVSGADEEQRMGIAKFLTISYAISPLICFSVVGALKASQAAVGPIVSSLGMSVATAIADEVDDEAALVDAVCASSEVDEASLPLAVFEPSVLLAVDVSVAVVLGAVSVPALEVAEPVSDGVSVGLVGEEAETVPDAEPVAAEASVLVAVEEPLLSEVVGAALPLKIVLELAAASVLVVVVVLTPDSEPPDAAAFVLLPPSDGAAVPANVVLPA